MLSLSLASSETNRNTLSLSSWAYNCCPLGCFRNGKCAGLGSPMCRPVQTYVKSLAACRQDRPLGLYKTVKHGSWHQVSAGGAGLEPT